MPSALTMWQAYAQQAKTLRGMPATAAREKDFMRANLCMAALDPIVCADLKRRARQEVGVA